MNVRKIISTRNQSGQTLIETMVAAFIMIMGITAALGLANYSLNATSGIRKQLIGVGLAREGMESVKNMRDTNWLNDSLADNCYNFSTGAQGDPTGTPAFCYRNWLNPAANGFAIKPQVGLPNFTIDFDATTSMFWNPVNGGSVGSYRLYTNAAASSKGLYSHDSTGIPSDYYRQVIIDDSAAIDPFSRDTGPRVLVTTRVWWTDKNCAASSSWPGKGRCSIELQSYMTNWKTF